MLWWSGHQSCSDGLCGKGNVLVGCRLAQGRHVEHLRRAEHPEEATALAAKADLLVTWVAVDEYARVTIENEASKLYEASSWAADKRAAEIVPRVLCRRLTVSRRGAGTWRLQSYNRGFCLLRRRCRLRNYTAKCLQNSRPSCSARVDLARAGRRCTATALRLGATPDAGPRFACALRKGKDGAIQARWVDREKDGRVKSRLVLKDYNRCQGRTQPEMFSPTPSTLSLKTMLVASSHDRHSDPGSGHVTIAIDVHTAFLHADVDQDLFAESPEPDEWYDAGLKEDEVWRLNKALYGYRRAPKLWHQHFVSILESLNYHSLLTDPSWFRNDETNTYFRSC